MEIETLTLGLIRENCYLLSSDNAAVVIDPGVYSQKIENFLTENARKPRMIMITHSHFDHIGGAAKLRAATGTPVAVGEKDAAALGDPKFNLSDRFHAHLEPFKADILLTDEQNFTVGDLTFRVIETPGHTAGGVCYLTGDTLFSGDTLFLESVGRTDFEWMSETVLLRSVRKLMTLDDGVRVLPGHGEPTDIGHERRFNPFL